MPTITSEIIADSICAVTGKRLTTFELDYPRIVHCELLTHRWSRNAASSRAIPTEKILDQILNNPAAPVQFGKNQSGMQDAGEHFALVEGKYTPQEWWDMAAKSAAHFSKGFSDAKYHKQVANRVTEAYQNIKVVCSTTDEYLANFFWLRHDEEADPTIMVLANVMHAAYQDSEPRILVPGEWHVPYYFDGYWSEYSNGVDKHGHTLQQALKISSSCCAQVSYRKNDDSLEKAEDLYDRFVNARKIHASPLEHQGTPIDPSTAVAGVAYTWPEGVTHLNRDGLYCSGNFTGWIQHRQLIPNHVYKG